MKVVSEGYFEDLARYPLSSVADGMRRARQTLKYFPTVAELLEIVHDVDRPRREREERHWQEVYRLEEQARLRLPPPRPTPEQAAEQAQLVQSLIDSIAQTKALPPPEQTPDEIAARKALLAEQARQLLHPEQGESHAE